MTTTQIKYEQHPIGACYPPLSPEQFAKLRASLHEPGEKSPAVLFEGRILDGFHYYKACLEESLEPKFESIEFPGWAEAIEFVVNRNEGRRQMDEDARAQVAHKLVNVKRGGRGGYKVSGSDSPKGESVTRRKAAAMMRVPVRSIDSIQQITDRAIPEVQAAYKAKQIKRGRAEKLASLPPEAQAQELAKWLDKKQKPKAIRARRHPGSPLQPNGSSKAQILKSGGISLVIEPDPVFDPDQKKAFEKVAWKIWKNKRFSSSDFPDLELLKGFRVYLQGSYEQLLGQYVAALPQIPKKELIEMLQHTIMNNFRFSKKP